MLLRPQTGTGGRRLYSRGAPRIFGAEGLANVRDPMQRQERDLPPARVEQLRRPLEPGVAETEQACLCKTPHACCAHHASAVRAQGQRALSHLLIKRARLQHSKNVCERQTYKCTGSRVDTVGVGFRKHVCQGDFLQGTVVRSTDARQRLHPHARVASFVPGSHRADPEPALSCQATCNGRPAEFSFDHPPPSYSCVGESTHVRLPSRHVCVRERRRYARDGALCVRARLLTRLGLQVCYPASSGAAAQSGGAAQGWTYIATCEGDLEWRTTGPRSAFTCTGVFEEVVPSAGTDA